MSFPKYFRKRFRERKKRKHVPGGCGGELILMLEMRVKSLCLKS